MESSSDEDTVDVHRPLPALGTTKADDAVAEEPLFTEPPGVDRASTDGSRLLALAATRIFEKQAPLPPPAPAPRAAPQLPAESTDDGANDGAGTTMRGSAASDPSEGATSRMDTKVLHGRKKGKKSAPRNIFLEFGMDSDAHAMTEVEIGGVLIKRFDFKRFWQSDKDLHRWQGALNDSSRFDKLHVAVRQRWHEDFRSDRADLMANHNAFRRQRSTPLSDAKITQAQELRLLRQKLDPKESKMTKKQRVASEMGALLGMPVAAAPTGSLSRGRGAVTEDKEALSERHRAEDPVLRAVPLSPISSRHGSQSDDESAVAQEHGLYAAAGHKGQHAEGKHAGSRLSQVQAPRTAALLIFRNGEACHAGEPVHFRRWPLATLSELLKVCSDGCRPLIAPAVKLLDTDLRTVKSPGEVEPGRAYLLKGQEAMDPPPLFFDHRGRDSPPAPSLRNVERLKHVALAEQDTKFPLSPKHNSVSSSKMGAPPWLSQETLEPSPLGAKWSVDRSLGMHLSWGGLGQPHQNQDYTTWRRALPLDRSIDRRSLSAVTL